MFRAFGVSGPKIFFFSGADPADIGTRQPKPNSLFLGLNRLKGQTGLTDALR
jgi:hypothetical protein